MPIATAHVAIPTPPRYMNRLAKHFEHRVAVVRDVQPRSVTLRFESTWSRKVPVRPAVDVVSVGYPGQVTLRLDPDSVQVTGPRHVVMGVTSVRTVKTTISFPDSLPHLIDIDTTGMNSAIHVRPAQIKAQLSLAPHS